MRELQPDAVIFSDAGPDIRWVGNEEGYANETNWSIMRRDEIYPGWPRYKELRSGHEDGTHWLPAEADVSIRPGWYYHPAEDHQVKTLPRLLDIYYRSVGRNAGLLLNLPVDDRGLVHETDVQELMALRKQLDRDFQTELAKNAMATASDERGSSPHYGADKVNDGDNETYWATPDSVSSGSIVFEFDKPTEVNRILLQEYIPLGQRIKNFNVEAEVDGQWQEIDTQTTIGYKRILRFDPVNATRVKVDFFDAKGPLAISNIELYHAPNLLTEPDIHRNKEGMVRLSVPDAHVEIRYTLDGSEPTVASPKYEKSFLINAPTAIKAIGYDPETKDMTESTSQYFDISKKEWKVIDAPSGNSSEAVNAIDDDPDTFWATGEGSKSPQEVVLDLGKSYTLKGFTYTPMQERYPFGIITDYEFSVSTDGRNWKTVAEGEFGNVVNHRIEQTVNFDPISGRYIRLKGAKVEGEDYRTSYGEIGVITEKR